MEVFSLVTKAITANLSSLFSKIAKDFGAEVEHTLNNKILEYQVEEYKRNYCAKTLLHRVQPKNLIDFYQPLFIVPIDKRNNQNSNKRIPTNSIKKLLLQNKCITLIGNAGSGKSTMVKYLFLNAIDTHFKTPIKVELRYLNDYDGNIIEYIKDKIFKLERLANNDKIIERLLSSGDFVFFLDGYDEINSAKKERTTKEIDDLVKLYNKNYYVLTSRPYTEIDLLPLFYNYAVCDLSDNDINEFIKRQIPEEERELCNKIIEAVNSKENNAYKSFLSNPLLLSMFILTFQSYSNIPPKRSEFYNQVFDALFSLHDSMSKLAYVREKQCGLSKEQFIDVLKLFSFMSYFDEKFIFNSHYINEKFTYIKEKKKSLAFDNSKLLDDLQIAIGILNKEGTDYTFPHRSLQEFFAALYITSLSDQNKKIIYKKITNLFSHRRDGLFNSKDNFHLLLSELDEKGVIQYLLIPFFDYYLSKSKLDSLKYSDVISKFFELKYICDSYNNIIKINDLQKANSKFADVYHSHQLVFQQKNPGLELHRKEVTDYANEKVVEEAIRPFLKKYMSKIKAKRDELYNYLVNENKSDSDIIDII
ncbi:MAG: putative signal transduction protein with Nacht domain [Bacteroidetes bacterium]|nr:putative signal transduction protein with Nacht domain [Bacteroidota bacterium]